MRMRVSCPVCAMVQTGESKGTYQSSTKFKLLDVRTQAHHNRERSKVLRASSTRYVMAHESRCKIIPEKGIWRWIYTPTRNSISPCLGKMERHGKTRQGKTRQDKTSQPFGKRMHIAGGENNHKVGCPLPLKLESSYSCMEWENMDILIWIERCKRAVLVLVRMHSLT